MKHSSQNRRSQSRNAGSPCVARSGAALLAALVCIAVVTIMATALVRTLLIAHRQTRWQWRQEQAQWLAESGVSRAAARLRFDPAYRGETWQLAASDFAGAPAEVSPLSGRVVIRIEPVAADDPRPRIFVEAQFPDELHHSVRRNQSVIFESSLPGVSP